MFRSAPDPDYQAALELPAEVARPVFVVGMNGSGTTMLAESLGRHPDLFTSRGETRVLPHLIDVARKHGDLQQDHKFLALWDKVRRVHVFVRRNGGKPVPIPSNWMEFPRSLSAIIDANYRYFAALQGKQRWCEKTPQYVQHMPELLSLFPECRFVHIIRDGRACAASFHRRWHRNVRLTAYRWSKVIETSRAAAPRLAGSYLEVRYEDLTADPVTWMRRICAHLGLTYRDDLLLSSQPQSEASGEPGTIHPRQVDRWRSQLEVDELRALEAIAGKSLAAMGYRILYDEGDRQPAAVRLAWWRAADNVRTLVFQLRGVMRNYSPKRVRRLGRRVVAGWWHLRTNKY